MAEKKTLQQEIRGGQGPVPAKSKRNKLPDRPEQLDRQVFEPNAAGIDIGAREIFVAVPADRDDHPVRKCETFTGDLHKLGMCLTQVGTVSQRFVWLAHWRLRPASSSGTKASRAVCAQHGQNLIG